MRSELILSAKAQIPNRFLLTNLVAKGARRLYRPGNRIQDTTNDVLLHLSRGGPTQTVMQPWGLHCRCDETGYVLSPANLFRVRSELAIRKVHFN